MAVQVTNTLTAIITSTEDTTGNVFVNRGTGNPTVDSTTGLYVQQFVTAGAAVDTAIPYPVGLAIDQLYIKNNDNVAVLTVKWTPAGGGVTTIKTIKPGGQLIFWESVTGAGVSSVTIASSVGATFVELFVGSI